MAIFRTAANGVTVRLDSRTVTVTANHAGHSVHMLAATARAENGNEPIRFQSQHLDVWGNISRTYTRVQQVNHSADAAQAAQERVHAYYGGA